MHRDLACGRCFSLTNPGRPVTATSAAPTGAFFLFFVHMKTTQKARIGFQLKRFGRGWLGIGGSCVVRCKYKSLSGTVREKCLWTRSFRCANMRLLWILKQNPSVSRICMACIMVSSRVVYGVFVFLHLILLLFSARTSDGACDPQPHCHASSIACEIQNAFCHGSNARELLSAADTPNAHSNGSWSMRNMPISLQRTGDTKCVKTALGTIASTNGVGSWACTDGAALSFEDPARFLSLRRAGAGTTPFA